MLVPAPDIIAAAVQAQSAHFASVGWGHIGYDAAHHNVLDGLAVGTRHGRNLLPEEPSPLVNLGFVSASLASVFQFPSHSVAKVALFFFPAKPIITKKVESTVIFSLFLRLTGQNK